MVHNKTNHQYLKLQLLSIYTLLSNITGSTYTAEIKIKQTFCFIQYAGI